MTPLVIAIVMLGAGAAGFVTTVAGLGGGILFLPVMVWALGAQEGVAVLSVSLLWGNIHRWILFREHTDYAVIRHIIWGSVPGALIGASLLSVAPEAILRPLIAAYLFLYVAYELWGSRFESTTPLTAFPAVGFVTGLLSGMFGAAGPVSAPFLLNYGLTKERFIATNMLSALIINALKSLVFTGVGTLTPTLWSIALGAGLAVSLGTWLGKMSLDKIDEARFKQVLLVALCIAGISFLFPEPGS